MPAYIVTFEINDAPTLSVFTNKLKTFNGYCPINRNSWAIVSDQKATDIRDGLKDILKPSDRMFVIRSGTEAAWINSYGEANDDWLKKYL